MTAKWPTNGHATGARPNEFDGTVRITQQRFHRTLQRDLLDFHRSSELPCAANVNAN